MLIRTAKPWQLPDSVATPESVYLDRRNLLKGLGVAAISLPSIAAAVEDEVPSKSSPDTALSSSAPYPARRNDRFTLDRPLTEEAIAARFNVFDEMSVDHSKVHELVGQMVTSPWKIHVGGLVERPIEIDVDDLIRTLGIEERLYRHRCVETWAMAVPWTGIPLRRFVEYAKPRSSARFLRMISFARPEQSPGWYATRRVFPYYEALSIEEATNELALLATGIYGHPLPPQHGAPLRLVVPWKYGLKSIKSIVSFQFTRNRPSTFWNDLSPDYYSFECNVDPENFPGPWSQVEERMLGTDEVRPTLLYNGYAEQVAHLYSR